MTTDLTIFNDGDEFEKNVNNLNMKSLADLPLGELTSLGVSIYGYAEALGKRSGLINYLAGKVLFEVRERLPTERTFSGWIAENKLVKSTAYNYIGLYVRVPNMESIRGLTAMQAYTKFGVLPPKKVLKAFPKPDDVDEPEKQSSQPAGGADGESVQSEGIGGRFEELEGEDVIDVPPEMITVDKETLQESLQAVTKDIVKSVVMECLEEVKGKFYERLEIADDEVSLADAALGGLLQGKPIQADARFEVLLDKFYSALLEVQDVGLRGSAKEALWLFEKLVSAAQGRLQHV
jgi:hypothetical protein